MGTKFSDIVSIDHLTGIKFSVSILLNSVIIHWVNDCWDDNDNNNKHKYPQKAYQVVNYRRSPLIQGGLEIPMEVTVCMPFNPKNKAALDRFESLLAEQYKEPVNGKHEDDTAIIFRSLVSQKILYLVTQEVWTY